LNAAGWLAYLIAMAEYSKNITIGNMEKSLKNSEHGFTLIELVIVITIIGILAAMALPRFAALQTEARIAKMNAALGSMKSAAAMAHANLLAKGYSSGYTGNPNSPDINMEGTDVQYVNGYPRREDIAALAGITGTDYSGPDLSVAGSARVFADVNHGACGVTYIEAAGNNQPTYTLNLSATDCQ
jgi:MSHA pilin protein MshA